MGDELSEAQVVSPWLEDDQPSGASVLYYHVSAEQGGLTVTVTGLPELAEARWGLIFE